MRPKRPCAFSATAQPLYEDGSLVVSFVLRDVNDMFRLRVAYTYQMFEGVKPTPTPIPGFVPAEDAPASVPSYYVPVEGRENLWSIVTAPEEYRAYGYMNGVGPAFYPADGQGSVVMNAPAADADADFDAFVRGFVPDTPDPSVVPDYYVYDEESGLYCFVTRDGETLYRAWGRMDGREPAFYPADAEGRVAADAQPWTRRRSMTRWSRASARRTFRRRFPSTTRFRRGCMPLKTGTA